MIIDQLPELDSIQETDEVPIERGTATYKAKLQKLKDLVAPLSQIIIANASNAKIGELRIIGEIAIATFKNDYGIITTDGINLGLEFVDTVRSLAVYFDGTSNVLGGIEITNTGYLYLLDSRMARTSGSYITGQCLNILKQMAH